MGQAGRLLLGAFESAEQAVAYAHRVSVPDGRDLSRLWRQARDAYLSTGPASASGREREFPPADLAEAQRRISVPLHARSLAGRSYRLAHVDPLLVVTTQPYVNLDRVDVLREQLEADPVATTFPVQTSVPVEPLITDGPTVTFRTHRRELVVSEAVAHQYETGEIDVLVRFEARPNYLIVEEVHGRFVLRNGNHRCVAAAFADLPSIGAVVVESGMPARAEDRWNKLPASAASASRPPLIADYQSPAPACIDVRLKDRAYETRLAVTQVSEYVEDVAATSTRATAPTASIV